MACKTKKYNNGGFVGNGVDNSDPGRQKIQKDSAYVSENLNYARELKRKASAGASPTDSASYVKLATKLESDAAKRSAKIKKRLK